MKKHSVSIMGHATSFSLESEFWEELKEIAQLRGVSTSHLIQEIDTNRQENLSSAIRVFILKALKQEIPSDKNTK